MSFLKFSCKNNTIILLVAYILRLEYLTCLRYILPSTLSYYMKINHKQFSDANKSDTHAPHYIQYINIGHVGSIVLFVQCSLIVERKCHRT